MNYRVVLQRIALNDLHAAHAWAARRARAAADRWLDRFQSALRTLDTRPDRCPLARESSKVDFELREFLFGRKPNVFRVIFVIDGETVRVLRIRRAQRRFLTQRQIDEASQPEE